MKTLKFLLFGLSIFMFGLLVFALVADIFFEGSKYATPFKDAHQKAVKSFVESKGFGLSRMRRKGYWNEGTVTLNDQIYHPSEIRLIGFTPENGPRRFHDARPPRKGKISSSESRPLTSTELLAMERLRLREVDHETLESEDQHSEGGSIRVIAPIFASQDCLKCHSVENGDLLGALEYQLVAW